MSQAFLKSAILLHKRDFVDSETHSTVLSGYHILARTVLYSTFASSKSAQVP